MQYTVQQGDTLYSLAARYGLTVAQLAAANQLSPNAELTPGQIITIPTIEQGGNGNGSEPSWRHCRCSLFLHVPSSADPTADHEGAYNRKGKSD